MPPLIEQKYECTTCNLSVNSLVQLQQHYTGRKHKAKMPADSKNNMSKATDITSSSNSFSHPLVHQNVLSKTHIQTKGHVLAAVVPQYNSKKIIKKYPNKRKSCSSETSNPKFHMPLEVGSSVDLQNTGSLQNQHEISYSYKDPTASNGNLITKTITSEITHQPTINHKSKIQHVTSCSQNNINKSHNFSIENILALNQLNAEYPIDKRLSTLSEKRPTNCNLELDMKEKMPSASTDKSPRSIISVRKDLMSPVNITQVDREYCNTEPVSNITQIKSETILHLAKKSTLTPSIKKEDASDLKTLTKTNSTTPFIRTPLEAIDRINNPISMQNITSMTSSHNKLQIKKEDEMSLKCYTCKKDIFDKLGNSKSLIYDHLIFGRASCKTCSKTVSCSGFTKLRNSNNGCCKSDQLVFTNNPVYFLIGELDNCEKNPCYYLAEYMMKIKILWIDMPWCQAVLDVKKFVKNPYKIPSFIFKGWDATNSTKQITPLNNKKDENHTTQKKINDTEIRTKSMNKENEYPSMKRSLNEKVNVYEDSSISLPAKKIKSSLRTFRIKEEFIDSCELKKIEYSENYNTTHIDCTDSINDKTSVTNHVSQGNVEIQHKQQMAEINKPSNCYQKNERHSKLDYNPTNNFAPQIIDVCSVKDLENPFKLDNPQILVQKSMEKFKDDISNAYNSSQYNEKLNIDNDLELSCGSTIMTPDASPQSSPVDCTKLATDILSKNTQSSNYTNLTTLAGEICVSKYMQDVASINSNSLVSEKTIEECPMCYQKLSLSKMTVNTKNMVLQFICSCNLNIHILPNINGKILWPFNNYDYRKSGRILKMRKKKANKRKLRF